MRPGRNTNIATLVDRMLLGRFAPASVLVNDGATSSSFMAAPARISNRRGTARLNIPTWLGRLQVELTSALRESAAKNDGHPTRSACVYQRRFAHVNLTVEPIVEPEALRGLLLVVFQPQPAPEPAAHKTRGRAVKKPRGTGSMDLEWVLRCTKESLQTTIEELETSNEELKSTNEELQSTNEEFQSANEELETSREEMQSLNEELSTVNGEMHTKVDELSRANDEMQNLLNSIEIATIFLDRELNINRYTDAARRLVNLIPTDVGRPLADLVSHLRFDHLVESCSEVLRTLVFHQTEVQTKDGEWFLMRIMPYRTAESVIDGLVLTFVDVNPVKKAERELATAKERLAGDLQAMTRLHEIGILFLREATCPSSSRDPRRGHGRPGPTWGKSIVGSDAGPIRTVAQRGFKKPWLEFWEDLAGGRTALGAALRRGDGSSSTISPPVPADPHAGTGCAMGGRHPRSGGDSVMSRAGAVRRDLDVLPDASQAR
jgi:PAS domain-containing protein